MKFSLMCDNDAGETYEMPCTALWTYYGHYNRVRELIYEVKQGSGFHADDAGDCLADEIESPALLFPMPSKSGRAAHMDRVATRAARSSVSHTFTNLTGKKRESWYLAKKSNSSMTEVDFGFVLSNPWVIGSQFESPTSKRILIIDDVLATGTTARFAARAFLRLGLKPEMLVIAVDKPAITGDWKDLSI